MCAAAAVDTHQGCPRGAPHADLGSTSWQAALTRCLAHRLVPLATGAAGGRTTNAILADLSPAEHRLLRSLHIDPAPLLALDTHEGRVASWILMRLASFPDLAPRKPTVKMEGMAPVDVADAEAVPAVS